MPKKLSQENVIYKFKLVHREKYDYSLVDFIGINKKVKIICEKHGVFEQTPYKHINGQDCPKCKNKNQTLEEIKKSLDILYNYKYDYSLFTQYINNKQKIKIICPIHGEFEKTISKHRRGQGCQKCSKLYRPTNNEFINKCIEVHGNKYDYSLTKYINNSTKIKIICEDHGEFEQTPNNHLRGQNCPFCTGNKMTTEYFIKKAKEIHNDKYDYSETVFMKSDEKINIICPTHGKFEQLPTSHLQGFGCSKCSNKYRITSDEFIKNAIKIHGDKYNYNLTEYKNKNIKIKIICPTHGVFEQSPINHLNKKRGCLKCIGRDKTNETFIEFSRKIHGDKYNYDLIDYVKSSINVKIICKEHGVFEQKPNHHLNGQGCPICNSSKGEMRIKILLEKNNIMYERQKSFKDCIDKKPLQFDFYLNNINTIIEYDGIQHFKPIGFFGGENSFNDLKRKDKIKTEYCKNRNINLIRISLYDNIDLCINKVLKICQEWEV